jgi:hypothetical protein
MVTKIVDIYTMLNIESAEATADAAAAAGATGPLPAGSALHAALTSTFKKYDLDDSGEIDKSELRALLTSLGMKVPQGELTDLMRQIGGSDMAIQYHEFEAVRRE